jgi:hypothetical protein
MLRCLGNLFCCVCELFIPEYVVVVDLVDLAECFCDCIGFWG